MDCLIELDEALPEPRLRAFIIAAHGVDEERAATACADWAARHLTAPERPVSFEIRPVRPLR
jgi:hypothetical protein